MDTGTTSPISHKVVFNVDLLHEVVFAYLHCLSVTPPADSVEEDKPGVEEATLACAARACRTPCSWSSLPNLLPLWLVLEPLMTTGESTQPPQAKSKYILTEEISPENWTRFCQYAARICEIRLDDITENCIDESSLSYALLDPRQTALLLFMSPSLRRLGLHWLWPFAIWGPNIWQEGAVRMLVRTACTDCPALGKLTFAKLEFPGPLRTAAEGLKHRLRRLKLGTLQFRDVETVQALAEISMLEQLSGIHVTFASAERVSVTGFRALRDLSIISDTAEDIYSYAPLSAWLDEFAVIVPIIKALKSLKLELLPDTPIEDVPDVLHLSHLAPHPLYLRNLEVFCLLVRDTGLVIEDSSFEAIAKAWPRLTSFVLDGGILPSAITLPGLAHFAKHCPRLHTLLLPHLDDAVPTAISPRADHALSSQGALRRLSFYLMNDMNICDPQATARAVRWMFPNLDVRSEFRVLLVRKATTAVEDNDDDAHEGYREDIWAKRVVGRAVWTSVLDVVQSLRIGGTH
ncbi:hypothetical protein C8T65DRAFT_775303 [Cerioporus squamosus]|nr:hypothetical protein C8T65DRAFT_775303 [Cerioporus squamosus]